MSSPYVEYEYADGSANTVRPTRARYPNGRTLEYAYGVSGSDDDLLSRVSQLREGSTVLVQYDYLGASSFARCDLLQPQIRWDLSPSGNSFSGLDSLDRTADCLWRKYAPSVSDPVRIGYTYDRASNRTSRDVASVTGNDELYRYDGLNRLTDLDRGDLGAGKITGAKQAEQWRLDATGNWNRYENLDFVAPGNSLDQNRTQNPANEITGFTSTVGASWAQPSYDRAGNMTTFPQPAAPTSSYSAIYDAWNRLVALSGGSSCAYDALNRKTVQVAASVTRHYYYSTQWQVLEERVGDSPDSADAERQLTWGLRYLDDLVLRDRSPTNDGTLSERLYAMQDANWNVIAVTNTSGAVQERYRYSAYGTPTLLNPDYSPESAGDFDWETLYCGYRWDANASLYCVRNRYLACGIGRWLSRDPVDYYAGFSLYQYASSRPTESVDTFGLEESDTDCNSAPCANNETAIQITAQYVDKVDIVKTAPTYVTVKFTTITQFKVTCCKKSTGKLTLQSTDQTQIQSGRGLASITFPEGGDPQAYVDKAFPVPCWTIGNSVKDELNCLELGKSGKLCPDVDLMPPKP